MGNALPTEKLDTHNYASWEYKLHQYLVGQGCWSYIEVSQETAPDLINPNYPTRQQGASKVMYCLETCVRNHMLSYIRDANAPKETWKNLKVSAASITTRKLQIRQELKNIRQRDISVTDYSLQIKDLCDSLGSINSAIDDDEMEHICLGSLTQKYGAFQTAITTQDDLYQCHDRGNLCHESIL